VIDSQPPEAFTMRRVADELGIGVMTLYGYVASKEELLAGVTALAFGEVHRNPRPDAAWDEQLRTEVLDLHGLASRHPKLVALVLALGSATPGLFRMRERMLEALIDGGFSPSAALRALGVLCNYALGFAGAQAGAAPIELPERIRELPAAEFPRLSALADRYADHLSDEAFEFGLDLLIDGLKSREQVLKPR
jgi:AcrR family transcriptional regulator